jgi:hypothetical protein
VTKVSVSQKPQVRQKNMAGGGDGGGEDMLKHATSEPESIARRIYVSLVIGFFFCLVGLL